jgi:phenylacetate-CoA ligase
MRTRGSSAWLRAENQRLLSLFRKVASTVPAYKDFLRKNHVRTNTVRTIKDFRKLPAINKKNYLRRYSLKDVCTNGSLKKPLVFTSTSGSTGDPFYFPRNETVDFQTSVIHELFFQNNPRSLAGPTLVLVCFGMGVWVGGIITYQAFVAMREQGYPISILTPGINKHEIFRALKKIGPHFNEIILVGYPPFIKDIIDEAADHSVRINKLNLRFIFAAEAFTEKFRDYVGEKGGVDNVLIDTMNIYGTADIGAMAFETPLAILIRRLAMQDKELFKTIFSNIDRTPTLAQYNPFFVAFEEQDGELLLTGHSAIPLIRYAIGDRGGVLTFNEMRARCRARGVDIIKEAKKAGIERHIYELPFVYVYERKDLSTTIYGLQIYPETIREALLEKPFGDIFTGKLALITKFNKNQDQYLEINLEARKGKVVSNVMKKRTLNHIVAHLRMYNSEFKELYSFIGKKAVPKLIHWPAEHPLHFKIGIKQKWVKK